MNSPCEEFADKIVDYVDGELPEDEVRAVAGHLVECDRCRRTAEALDRSLDLARTLWSDNLGQGESTAPFAPSQKSWRIRVYAVAASIFVTGSILMLTISNHHPQPASVCFEEVERQVVRAGRAAELLAATQIVAQCEGMESIVEQQYRYILHEYAGTPAAENIKSTYSLPLGGVRND